MRISYALPYPPTVGNYWGISKRGMYIKKRGIQFRKDVWAIVQQEGAQKLEGRLNLVIDLVMPDKRKRDIDNVLKALLDALQHAGAYLDDNQIDKLSIQRCPIDPPGRACVHIFTND